jgi:hypothetical protein
MITKDIDKKYLWLLDIIKDITNEFILEPSIKISNNSVNINRYTALIPRYQDVLLVLNRIPEINIDIFNFVAVGMLSDVDCIIGVDNDKIKVYLDYGHMIKAIICDNSKFKTKEYHVLPDNHKHLALKYSYMFDLIDTNIDTNNWRHVYQVSPDEYHISMLIPIKWRGYRIYLVGITNNSITIYHR